MARRKRANAEGSIYWDASRARWVAKLVVGRHPDGRLIRRVFTGKTRKAVTSKLDAAKAALDQGLGVPDDRATVATFAAWWAAEVLPAEGLAPATERWYGEMLRYVLPLVGHRTLTGPQALTPADVEAMAAALAKAGLSHRVQVAARTTLGKVLRAAEQRGLVGRNVARLAAPPKNRGKARKVKALTTDEVARLLDLMAATRWRPVLVVAFATGLRPGELLGLHWSDVHLDTDPRLSVRYSVSHASGTAELKAPKRDRSRRTVPLAPEAVQALRAWRKAQAAERLAAGPLWCDDWPDLVFPTADGRPQRVDTYRHALRDEIARANKAARDEWTTAGHRGDPPSLCPHVHPHQTRHTYATHLLEAGTPIHVVGELLGDTVATVEAAYSHVLRPKYETAAVVSGLFQGRAG